MSTSQIRIHRSRHKYKARLGFNKKTKRSFYLRPERYVLYSISLSGITRSAWLVQLKGRFKVRRLSVRIADAHRRLVRTIRLHYHSKPVGSLTDLRMPENAAKWRLAATVHVSCLCVFLFRDLFRWTRVGICSFFLS